MTAKPNRLLMTADTVGGVWTYAIELVRSFSDHNIEVVLATMGAPVNREQREQIRSCSHVHVCESSFKLEWMTDPWADVIRAGDWLLLLEEQFHPDLVHLNGFAHGALPWTAPKLVVGHSCVLSWWNAVKSCAAPSDWNQYFRAVTRGLDAADMVVVPTRAMKDEFQHHYGLLHPIHVIHNGRDAGLFRHNAKEKFILSAGRIWDEGKNIAQLIKIADALAWPVYVAGEQKHPDGGIQIGEYPVHLLGTLSSASLAEWMGRASIYAAPALYEPFGLSILEAALSGCALVLGDIAPLRELWEGAALFVSPHNPQQLKQALQHLIENPANVRGLAVAAQKRAAVFTPQQMVNGYLNAYAEILIKRKQNDSRRSFANTDVLSLCAV